MKILVYNIGYFFREAKTIFKVDLASNVFSIFSIGFILFILSIIFSGWFISTDIVEALQNEAEINVYYEEGLGKTKISKIENRIEDVDGVSKVIFIDESESYNRMEEVLGEEADILDVFERNPFDSFTEVRIDIEKSDSITGEIENIEGISYIRDNKDVIGKLKNIVSILTVLGILVIAAVGISTVFVISHIIRQGIYNNRSHIRTLKLLGAPDSFIGTPFVLEGLFLTLSGGLIASILIFILLFFGYGQIGENLLFLPLPPVSNIVPPMVSGIIVISFTLGILGSVFGLKSTKSN